MQHAQIMMSVLALLALATGAVLAWLITRSVTRPLQKAIGAAQRIAAKDLSAPVASELRRDEIGELQNALTEMRRSLLQMVEQIRCGTVNVSSASTEMASAGEQSKAVSKGNPSVTALDQMTLHNAALGEQRAASAESLKDQAAQLTELLSTFKVGRAGHFVTVEEAPSPGLSRPSLSG